MENLVKYSSPTGVSYYESDYIFRTTMRIIKTGFRPQQGLTIMNPYLQNPDKHYLK